ncbi:LPS assembly protein LptD [secondary endosymbiont of Ctenarytaina eucalypti]|uniref:LPS-assembly protein LptD n=1 Tax=secondary endosymbiont of Ctenarytaina eucalypti TaxID=1199245 RepID=J3TXK9_9ENTR|nr:LPS assembly protein LptD [secondary endosymbiont of Ctenarytaina eucalypti]AFP84940.1 organic solvent tolerance protein OstA [secondary endosymbiont of Ctenarytaina eucalypti]
MTAHFNNPYKKYLPTVLASLMWLAFNSQKALANLGDECFSGVTAYAKTFINDNPEILPVHIQADKAASHDPAHALFSGNVNIEQGNNTLTADKVELIQRQESNQTPVCILTATGNVHYANNEIKLQGDKAWSNLNTKDTNVYHGNYQLVGRQGRGAADTIKQRGNNRYTVLKNGNFTSCMLGDDSWIVSGSEVIHDREEQVAEIWNARFTIGKVPVFYSPYLQMPVSGQRCSGLLIPNAKYGSNNGFAFYTPYYLALAPNYDTTITPNYMSRGRTQIQTECRYITTRGEGLVELDWLPKDQAYSSAHTNTKESDRCMVYWYHDSVMNQVWRFNVDYTKVSDSNYFDDLDAKYGPIAGYAPQKFSISYTNKHWDSILSHKQFQVFDKNISAGYRTEPQFALIYYKNNIGPLNLKVISQAGTFVKVRNDHPATTRLHIEPTLNLPLTNIWGHLNTEAKLMATYYQQDNSYYYKNNTIPNHHRKRSVKRFVPQFKTGGKMVFERDITSAPNYTQTLATRLQYLYVPYRNQENINVFDSMMLQTSDYSSLFRERIYSGLDRIASVNQLVGGLTTQIYKDQCIERFNASLGQIYYFSRPRTEDINNTFNNYANIGKVVWAGDAYWQLSNQLRVRGGLQYNSRINSISHGDAVLQYRFDENNILQLNYRYTSPKYTDQILTNISHPKYRKGLSQMRVTGSWPLIHRWSLVGVYCYDTKSNQTADQCISLRYNTCCWAINLGYERKITGLNNTESSSQYENKVSFNIELRGLNSNSSRDTYSMLTSST